MSKAPCLKEIMSLKKRIAVGLNSGTSADGIDAAVIRIEGNGYESKIDFIMGKTYRMERGLRSRIIASSEPDFGDGEKWLRLDIRLARLFSDAALKTIRSANLRTSDVALIGSHGQTIRHLPDTDYGTITCQIADPARIAVNTGITTVGDFRIADAAAGGQGAPLTPIANAIIFGQTGAKIAVLNIGGIANITVISPSRGRFRIAGCDTGPGNMLIDYLAFKLFRMEYDKAGRLASAGSVDKTIIRRILSSRFFMLKGPKSAGRETFGRNFGERFLMLCRKRGLRKHDIMATASMLTVSAFRECCRLNNFSFDRLILSGGGAKNIFLRNAITKSFPTVEIVEPLDYGIPVDYLEAVSFAILANEAICSNRYSLRAVTGAQRSVVLGKICQR